MTTVGRPGLQAAEQVALRGVLYSRQSHNKTKSINEQIEAGLNDAERESITVAAQYSDGTSASQYARYKRDDWARLLAELEQRLYDVLILWESSRGDRDPIAWLQMLKLCAERGILIRIVNDRRTYNPAQRRDWKTLAEDGLDNADESKKLSDRLLRGMAASAESGRPHAKTPFGYMRVYDEYTRRFIRQVPDERLRGSNPQWSTAQVVRNIFTWIADQVAILEIRRRLISMEVPAPRLLAALDSGDVEPRVYRTRDSRVSPQERWADDEWSVAAVRHIAKNVAYLGRRQHHDNEYEDCWEPLVNENQFWDVQRILSDPTRQTWRPTGARHYLSFLMRCWHCGGMMTYLPAQQSRRQYNASYRCRSASHASVPARESETLVNKWMINWLSDEKHWQLLRASDAGVNQTVVEARTRISRLTAELNEWRALLESDNEDETPSPTAFAIRERKLLRDIGKAEELALTSGLPPVLQQFAGKTLEQVCLIWFDLDLNSRRDAIRAVAIVEVRSAGKGRRGQPLEDRIVVQARTEGPKLDYSDPSRKIRPSVVEDVAAVIRKEITTGAYRKGDPIPPRRVLSAQFEADPATIGRAMKLLADEGLIETRKGIGSRVC